MGQPLSHLQQQILRLALHNKQRENRDFGMTSGADVFYSEVLATIYLFPVKKPPRTWPSSRIFEPAKIGRGRYRSVSAAVSRSMLRLAQRGLVIPVRSRHSTWAGCSLTEEGVEIARRLEPSVNTALV